MNIKVLDRMNELQNFRVRTRDALNKLNFEATIEKVIDYSEILSFGLVRTPGLIIDNKIVVRGSVPTVEQLQNIIKQQIIR